MEEFKTKLKHLPVIMHKDLIISQVWKIGYKVKSA